MKKRVARLRHESREAKPCLSTERAELITEFYKANEGKHSVPISRALAFKHLCENQTIYIGIGELIVGERGPSPKASPTYPELTCHSIEDLKVLRSRDKTGFGVTDEAIRVYEEKVIPYWRGRSIRDRIFDQMPAEWIASYEAGIFTEFMEQRAPGHTALDGKIYRKGFLALKRDISESMARINFLEDPEATAKLEQLKAMDISCDAIITFAKRHSELALKMAADEGDPQRRRELERIAEVCDWVPANAPRNLWEALQMYWFVHLGVIIELNGWDAFSPGHLDHHLYPFYKKELQEVGLTREEAKELIGCFWIKFNNHPAPPKVGVTAAESATYNDFVNINLGGLNPDGSDATNDMSDLILEIAEEMHILQPQCNIQLSRKTPNRFLKAACRVIRRGYGYPSVFNADMVIEQMLRAGKSVEDARAGGTSGCVETGCFGKEAYILTGYFNLPKVLEITLNNGSDPMTGNWVGLETGDPQRFRTFNQLIDAFQQQMRHFIEIKVRGNQRIERMFATSYPATFLSVVIDDCIATGKDYNDGGARYNTTYIQGVGTGTITDSLSAIKKHVFEDKTITMDELLTTLGRDFQGREALRLLLTNKTPRYGNDDDDADALMQRVFDGFVKEVEGRPNTKGGRYYINMLPTTSHIYFGSVMGASPDGRKAGTPLSEGISPVQGADRRGPTAVIRSTGKMDHVRTGGTLLNMSFMPSVLEGEEGIEKLAGLIRTYFRLGGHHVQFNVVDSETLRRAQERPEEYRDLIVRVAGYSDYFCDLGKDLQDEIISRTRIEGL